MTLYYGRQLSKAALIAELPDLTRSKPGILTVRPITSSELINGCHFSGLETVATFII